LTVYLFGTAYRSMRYRKDLETARRRAAELLQAETAARLALLQAQIEPHFLFNTLANVQSLIKRRPDAAEAMLDSLNRYLRASLGRTRQAVSSLQQEIELVQALLSIAVLRLGPRLDFEIEVPAGLHSVALPPLLLQPLVENALLHGIEPSIDGGTIRVVARAERTRLSLRVEDSGVGLTPPHNVDGAASALHHGVGLANVRARLTSLYGDAATLEVCANQQGGVTAELLLPLPLPQPID
ncbi:MAG: sensor histidine kinase, partial [Janthinobacterium lividum]